jgi:hypothetical protein
MHQQPCCGNRVWCFFTISLIVQCEHYAKAVTTITELALHIKQNYASIASQRCGNVFAALCHCHLLRLVLCFRSSTTTLAMPLVHCSAVAGAG